MMKPIVVLVLSLSYIGLAASQRYNAYDCRRVNSGCSAGRCIGGTATNANLCNCLNTGRVGYNCQLPSASLVTGNCPVTCLNGGTCYQATGVFRCFCPPEFTGFSCNQRRVKIVSCTPTLMQAVINPNTNNFQGKIYVKGHSSTVGCEFPPSTDPANPGYLLDLSLLSDGPCAVLGGLNIQTSQDGVTSRTYTVIVQHQRTQTRYTDEEHTLTCSGNDQGLSSVSLNNIDSAAGNMGGDTATGNFSPMDVSVSAYPNRNVIQAPVGIGQPLYIEATPRNAAVTPFHRMTRCIARASADNNSESVTLVDNSCITPEGVYAGAFALSKVGGSTLLAFYAFKFDSSSSMIISCEFNVCTQQSDLNCSPLTCPDGTVGRRKREAGNSSLATTASKKIYVVSSLQDLENMLDNYDKVTTVADVNCYNTPFIVAVSLVGTLLLVVLIMLILVCWRLRTSTKEKELHVYTNEGAHQ